MIWQNLILDKLHSVHTAQQSYLLPYWPITYNPSFPIGPLHNPLLSIGPAGAARPFPIVWDNLKWQISSILLVYVIIPSSLLVHVTMHVFFFRSTRVLSNSPCAISFFPYWSMWQIHVSQPLVDVSTPCFLLVHATIPCLLLVHNSKPCFLLVHASIPWLLLVHVSTPCFPLVHVTMSWLLFVHVSTPCFPFFHVTIPCLLLVHDSTPCFLLVHAKILCLPAMVNVSTPCFLLVHPCNNAMSPIGSWFNALFPIPCNNAMSPIGS